MSNASTGATAEDATVDTVDNPSPDRLRADVAQCQRVLDELVDGEKAMKAKYTAVVRSHDSKLREVRRMVTAAERELKKAKAALKDGEA